MKKQEFYNHNKPCKLLDQVRDVMRLKHYAFRTEQTYISWIKRFIFFHDKKHSNVMGESEVEAFLTWPAVEKAVSKSTQNQALKLPATSCWERSNSKNNALAVQFKAFWGIMIFPQPWVTPMFYAKGAGSQKPA